MKCIAVVGVIWAFLLGVMYAFGAFVAADFDIRNWDSAGRAVVGFFGVISLFVAWMVAEEVRSYKSL